MEYTRKGISKNIRQASTLVIDENRKEWTSKTNQQQQQQHKQQHEQQHGCQSNVNLA